MKQLFAGLYTEGPTDIRFLETVVKKTLENVVLDCRFQLDIELLPIEISKTGLGYVEQILQAAKSGVENFGIMILCAQTDTDNKSLPEIYQYKINPAISELERQNAEYCKILVAVIPIQETEAWMLADKELLKREIGTDKTDNELGINCSPETIANPKEVIEQAIRIARKDMTKKRRKDLTISELYLPIGQEIELEKLEQLYSFADFKKNVRRALKQLNYI